MGHIVNKIQGDVDIDPDYEKLTFEFNADNMVHIHLGNIRIDFTKEAYNKLYDGMMASYEKMKKRHQWE